MAPGPTRLDDCRGPPQSLEGNKAHIGVALPSVWSGLSLLRGPDTEISHFWVKDGVRKQIEEELQSEERSKTDLALIEEASRYGSALNPCGLLASGFSSSPFFFLVGLHWGSITTILGVVARHSMGKPRYCSMLWGL